MKSFDVVIVGAGLVGALLACRLKQQGRTVLLVERQAQLPPVSTIADSATLALTKSSVDCLLSEHILPRLTIKPARITSVNINRAKHVGRTQIAANELGVVSLGAGVATFDLLQAIHHQCQALEIPCLFNTTIEHTVPGHQAHQIILETGEIISAALLVCADGAYSKVASQLGFSWRSQIKDQMAVIANLQSSKSCEGVALERFFSQGTFAILPWHQKLMTNVWSLPESEAKVLADSSDKKFLERCQVHTPELPLNAVYARRIVPLKSAIASSLTGPRTVLMGNAAHLIHPIAAQGFNLSVHDIQLFCRLALTYQDLGSLSFLQAFAQSAQSKQSKVFTLTQMISDWVASEKIPPGLQSLGLGLMDTMKPMRNRFARFAMGLKG